MRKLIALFLASLALMAVCAVQAQAEEPLRPEQVFPASAESEPGGLRIRYEIREGYYLYRSKFRFRAQEAGVALGEPRYPHGKVKQDPFFGRMEIYRGPIEIHVPVEEAAGLRQITLDATSQGCADQGFCYPPHTQILAVRLPATASPPAATGPLPGLSDAKGGAGGLLSRIAGGEDDFLEADQAFQLTAKVLDRETLLARWDIAEGYYLYKQRFKFAAQDSPGITLGDPVLPPGEPKEDPAFGRVVTYHNRVDVRIPITREAGADRVALEVGYQGCAEAGICYPPMTRTVSLDLSAGDAGGPGPAIETPEVGAASAVGPLAAGTGAPVAGGVTSSTGEAGEDLSEQDRLAALLAGEHVLVAALWFFGFGLLLAFTPCVFPMIPILSGIIVGQGSRITTRRAFALSLVYVLAMSVTYTLAGVLAGMFGKNLQAALQNPWALSAFAAVFVVLALSMFGFYELQLPSALQSRLTELSNRQRGGSLVGVAVMGLLSALIVGPCVAPPLAGALIYIGQTGDAVLGGLALFALSLGMGAPLVVVGTLEG